MPTTDHVEPAQRVGQAVPTVRPGPPGVLARGGDPPGPPGVPRRTGDPPRLPEVPRRTGGRDRWKAAFVALATLGLIGGIAWALLGSRFFVVRSVQVTGSRQVPGSLVRAAAGIAPGTPLIRIDTSAVARRVERITQVQSARVIRSWPDSVVIWVKRRKAVLAVPAGGGFDRMDRYGVVLGWASARPRGLVLLAAPPRPAAAWRGSAAVYAAGTVVSDLPGWLRHRVAVVRAKGSQAVILTLHGGAIVVWGGTGRAAAKAKELAILLRTNARYYDVSDPATAVTGSAIPGTGRARHVPRTPASRGD